MNNNPYDATNYDQQGDTIDGPATGIGGSEELGEEAGYGSDGQGGQGIGEVGGENTEGSDQNLDGQPGAYEDPATGSGIAEPGADVQDDQPYADSEMGSGIAEPGIDGQDDQPYADSEMGSGIAEPGIDDQEAYGHSGNAQPGLSADHGINGEVPDKFDMSEKAHQSAEPTGTVEPTRGGGYEYDNGNAGYASQGTAPSISDEKAPDTKTVTHDMPQTAVEKPSVSERINQAGKKLEKSSTSYLSSRRFNMSQRGHVSGRESAPFEDDE